jgi:hypothetical protein
MSGLRPDFLMQTQAADASAAPPAQDPILLGLRFLMGKNIEQGKALQIIQSIGAAGVSEDRIMPALTNLDKTGVPWDALAQRLAMPDMQDAARLTSLWRPFVSGLSANWADEIGAALKPQDPNSFPVKQALTEAEHPKASMAASVGGAVIPGAITGGLGAAGMGAAGLGATAARIAGGTLAGAAEGAASGAGAARTGERASGAGTGAITGAVLGGAASAAPELGRGLYNAVADKVAPVRAVNRELGQVAQNPNVRKSLFDQMQVGLKPALAEGLEAPGPLLARTQHSPVVAPKAVAKGAARKEVAASEMEWITGVYDQFRQVQIPYSRHPDLEQIVERYLGRPPEMDPTTGSGAASDLIDAYQQVREFIRKNPTKGRHEFSGPGTTAAVPGQQTLKNEAEFLEIMLNHYGVDIEALNKVYGIYGEAQRAATRNLDALTQSQASQAATRLGGGPTSDVHPHIGMLDRLINMITPHEATGNSMMRALEPEQTGKLLQLPGPQPHSLAGRGARSGAVTGGLLDFTERKRR